MKKKYYVQRYYEAYEDYVVEAESSEEAENIVLAGVVEPDDVTVTESEIVECREDI